MIRSRSYVLPTICTVLLVGLVAACSRDADKEKNAEQAATQAGQGVTTEVADQIPSNSCRVIIRGDETLIYTREGDSSSVSTEYWMTEDEVRRAVEIMTKVTNADLSEEALAKKVVEEMKRDPKRELLRINCSSTETPRTTVSIWAAPTSKYANVPFSAKTYTIPPQSAPGQDVGAGELAALVRVGSTLYAVTEPGQLVLTRFDKNGIVGNFSIVAVESGPVTRREGATPKRITIEGTVNYSCTMHTQICREAAG